MVSLELNIDEHYASHIGRHLKPSDVFELKLMYGIKGVGKRCAAIVESVKGSYKVIGLSYKNKPCVIAGVNLSGRIWMVSTQAISKCTRYILRNFERLLFLLSYGVPSPVLFNQIDPLSTHTIRLLRRLGFSIEQDRGSKYLRIEVQNGSNSKIR